MSICPTGSGKSVRESGAGSQKSQKASKTFARNSKSNDRNGSKKRGRISSDMSNTDTPVSSRPVPQVKVRMEDTVKDREKEIVPIKLTNSLNKVINCDKDLFVGFYLPTIPARYSINEILKQYYESMTTDADRRREFGSKLEKLFNLYVGDYISNFEAVMYEEILQGKEPYYYGLDRCKPKHLGNAKISKENDGSVKMSSLFGLPHLLRFLHTAHVICRDALNPQDTQHFLRWAVDFVKFLDARVKTFFDKEQDFYPAAVAYLTRYYSNKFEYQWK
ncbi:MRG domain-containing protein [Ditylenchus destructor]|nr:MRG domain-containing protein [Ditylenchus destructor]